MPNSQHLVSAKDNPISEIHANEVWELLSWIGFQDLPSAKEFLIDGIIDSGGDWQHELLEIAKGKVFSVEGNIIAAVSIFQTQREKLLSANFESTLTHNLIAYCEYEYSACLAKAQDPSQSIRLLKAALFHSSSERLSLAIKYGIQASKSRNSKSSARADSFFKYQHLFDKLNMHTLSLFAKREAAKLLAFNGEREKSLSLLEETANQASAAKLEYLQELCELSMAYQYFKLGLINDSKSRYTCLLQGTTNFHNKIVALENLYLIARREENEPEGIDILRTALTISQSCGAINRTTGINLYLGKHYHQKKENSVSAKYLVEAFRSALHQLELGFSFSSGIHEAIVEYDHLVQHLHLNRTEPISRLHKLGLPVDIPRTWQFTKDTFHANLILYHRKHTGKTGKYLSILKMKPTSYYSLLGRLKERGIDLGKGRNAPPPEGVIDDQLQEYIAQDPNLSWKEINQRFEDDFFRQMYARAGYNKQRLAAQLDLSYSAVLEKTRSFTQAVSAPSDPPLSPALLPDDSP